jgi:transcriptional regulator with XRE-family HTH domain
MLLFDTKDIGNKLLAVRKRLGLTQFEAAEAAGLSNRTYADIERGSVNTRLETILRICDAFHITPDEILTEEAADLSQQQEELLLRLDTCTPQQRETAFRLLSVYLQSLS